MTKFGVIIQINHLRFIIKKYNKLKNILDTKYCLFLLYLQIFHIHTT